MANEEANRPNPELCLSPIYRNMYVPGPDISEAMELLDCLGKEPWNQPNASAEERRMQWVRGDRVRARARARARTLPNPNFNPYLTLTPNLYP